MLNFQNPDMRFIFSRSAKALKIKYLSFSKISTAILFCLVLSCSAFQSCEKITGKKGEEVEALPEIIIPQGQNHLFTLSNKQAGFFLGNSQHLNSGGFEGWTVDEFHYLQDYDVFVNRQLLKRAKCTFHYFPYGFLRDYAGAVKEEFTLIDSLNIILLQISPFQQRTSIRIRARIRAMRDTLFVDENRGNLTVPFIGAHKKMTIRLAGRENNKAVFYFVLHDSTEQDNFSIKELIRLKQERIQRYRNMYKMQALKTDNETLHKALRWTRCSMDALVTNQRGPGIWAGLPWFNNYWGRDTFISFPGALLVTGEFETARRILQNFAAFQLMDENDQRYGRIPNRITNRETIYNTTDGTWWFMRELYEYVLYSGDTLLVKEMWPVVKRALEGALKYRVDDLGFLIHEDADTWMDAKGANGAWSARGNRAVEIQALWYTALQIGAKFAACRAEKHLAQSWQDKALLLKANFEKYFWNQESACLYDHLNEDSRPDTSLRPNQLFAVTVPDLPGILPLLSLEKQRLTAKKVTQYLTLEYGVLSLFAADKNFHPWHHYPPYYVPDAAYHNGLIWTWLAGPVISAQLKFGQVAAATKLYGNEAKQILREDAIGNFSELMEALPRTGETETLISGTVSQAWSLAEFQRNFYQDIIGYQPDALNNKIFLHPVPLKNMHTISCRLPYKKGYLDFSLEKEGKATKVKLHAFAGQDTILGYLRFKDKLQPLKFHLTGEGGTWEYMHVPMPAPEISMEKKEKTWTFAKINPEQKFPVITEPGYQILQAKNIFMPPGQSGNAVIFGRDDKNDDIGFNKHFRYPLNPAFAKGIFDIASFTIYDMGADWGFRLQMRNLADPGWHAEYGFQLSFLAIAIADAQIEEALGRDVGRGSNYTLSPSRAFNRIIYVGGGFEICDAQKNRLAAYLPYKQGYPIGFVEQKQIRFKIPKTYLPGLSSQSIITLLAGGQDDHGGAGIGEFREVRKKAGEWHGGGADRDEGSSRIYDVLEIN